MYSWTCCRSLHSYWSHCHRQILAIRRFDQCVPPFYSPLCALMHGLVGWKSMAVCFVMFFARLGASSFRVLMCSPNFLPPTLQQLHLFIANPPINTLCPSPVDMRAALLITVLFTDACRQIALALFLFACGIVLLTIGECWPTSFKAQRFPLYRLTCCRSLHSYRSH